MHPTGRLISEDRACVVSSQGHAVGPPPTRSSLPFFYDSEGEVDSESEFYILGNTGVEATVARARHYTVGRHGGATNYK